MSIGVFDSGIGGLTVLAALRAQLPAADLLYLGDTARVPYGRRSADTVASYAVDCAQWLLDQGCEQLVIACNTASAYGAEAVRAVAGGRPVYEVVGAGVDAACAAGTGPNGDRTECVSCIGTTYSTIGQCQDCVAPNICHNAHRT